MAADKRYENSCHCGAYISVCKCGQYTNNYNNYRQFQVMGKNKAPKEYKTHYRFQETEDWQFTVKWFGKVFMRMCNGTKVPRQRNPCRHLQEKHPGREVGRLDALRRMQVCVHEVVGRPGWRQPSQCRGKRLEMRSPDEGKRWKCHKAL